MLRIIDLTTLTGAYAARLFAEQGHEVIRVEPPEGDELRRLAPRLRGRSDLESGAFHHFLNAGKKSLTARSQIARRSKGLSRLAGPSRCFARQQPSALRRISMSEGQSKTRADKNR